VYKLAAREGDDAQLAAAIKFSDNPEKTTNPGVKQVWRVKDAAGMTVADVLSLEDDPEHPDTIEKGKRYAFWHPQADYRHFSHTLEGDAEVLLTKKLEDGRPLLPEPSLEDIRAHVRQDLESFDQSYKRLLNPHIYKVSVTGRLRALKLELIQNYLGDL
jgi:nicotinate phosphoribosyltransferase